MNQPGTGIVLCGDQLQKKLNDVFVIVEQEKGTFNAGRCRMKSCQTRELMEYRKAAIRAIDEHGKTSCRL